MLYRFFFQDCLNDQKLIWEIGELFQCFVEWKQLLKGLGFFCLSFQIGPKGQLISECPLGVIDFPKTQQKIWQISALESKKWGNQQNKGTFLWYYNLHMIIWALYCIIDIIECLYFMIWPFFKFSLYFCPNNDTKRKFWN